MADRSGLLYAALAATLAAAVWVTVQDQPQVPARRSATDSTKPEPGGRRSPVQAPPGDLRLPARQEENGAIIDLFALRQHETAGGAKKQERPLAPPLPFVFLGRYADGDGIQVFLGDGDQIHAVKAGDVIEQKYRVDKIDSVVRMTYLPLNEPQILAIGDM
jgi:hypothetical protein